MPLKAGVVQFSPLYGRVVDNLDRLEARVAEAASQGVEFLVLPEMAWTGYLWADPQTLGPLAEEAGSGRGQDRVAEWARRWKLHIAYGFPEREGNRLYNAQGLTAPEGQHAVYRKTHLFEADEWWSEEGDTGYLQWETPWGTAGSGICMDLNYPDLADYHTRARTRILAFSTNWIDQDFDVIPYWQEKLRSTDERGFDGLALFANRGGEEFGLPFRGQSTIFWEGRPVATIEGKDDGVLTFEAPLSPSEGPGR